jgi:uncharacterized protein YeaO (DUF488 family)
MRSLFTIGYEGANIADFVATLRLKKVDVLLDVRELPASRRKGFSKRALAEHLEKAGIVYRHDKRLGSPREIRHQLYADRDYDVFFRGFKKHLSSQMDLVKALSEELTGNVALMCYERDPKTCHRKVVAEAFSKFVAITPQHLGVEKDAARKNGRAARTDFGEGVSAAWKQIRRNSLLPGIDEDSRELLRLFPVRYRRLSPENRFDRFDHLHLIMGTMQKRPWQFIIIGLLRSKEISPEDLSRQPDLF